MAKKKKGAGEIVDEAKWKDHYAGYDGKGHTKVTIKTGKNKGEDAGLGYRAGAYHTKQKLFEAKEKVFVQRESQYSEIS